MRAGRNVWREAGTPLVLALLLFLVGCSGGGGGGTPPTPPGGPIFGPGGGGGGGSPPTPGWSASDRVSNLRGNSIEMFTPSVALTSQAVAFVAWTEKVFAGDC